MSPLSQDAEALSLTVKCAHISQDSSDQGDLSVPKAFFRPMASSKRCTLSLVVLAFAIVIGLLWLRVEFLAHRHIDDKALVTCTQRLVELEEKIQRQEEMLRDILTLLPENKMQKLSRSNSDDDDDVSHSDPDTSGPQEVLITGSREVEHKIGSSRRKRSIRGLGCSQCVSQQQFDSLYSRVITTTQEGHPSAQLVPHGYPSSTTDLHNGANIKWTDVGPFSNSILAHNTHALTVHADGKLEIISSGVYFIYMKVTFNGRKPPHQHRQPPHCTVVMSLYRNGADPASKLMASTVTQIEWGRHLGQHEGHYVYAYDSTQQMGTYRLARGDVITVHPAENSHRCRVVMRPEKTYVGAVLLRY